MDGPSESMRDLARRLVALEATTEAPYESQLTEVIRVLEKLRISLTRFAGTDGFTSLLRRALALARAHLPSLEAVKVRADGVLDGFEQTVAKTSHGGAEEGAVIIACFLDLLVTFIGEPLTLQLMREAWPDLSHDEGHSRSQPL